jgi:hypothetical protein
MVGLIQIISPTERVGSQWEYLFQIWIITKQRNFNLKNLKEWNVFRKFDNRSK